MNRIRLLLFFAAFLLVFYACKEKYKDADLVERYIRENNDVVFNQAEYYLLVLRDFPLSCTSSLFGYDADAIMFKVQDSLQGSKIIVLFDNDYFKLKYQYTFLKNGFDYIIESPQVLDNYAFPFTPHLFRIKKGKITEWKKMN
jgi:hypothetical protein